MKLFSHIQSLEITDQGAAGSVSVRALFLECRCCLLSVSSHVLSSVCAQGKGVHIHALSHVSSSSYKGTRPVGLRFHHYNLT